MVPTRMPLYLTSRADGKAAAKATRLVDLFFPKRENCATINQDLTESFLNGSRVEKVKFFLDKRLSQIKGFMVPAKGGGETKLQNFDDSIANRILHTRPCKKGCRAAGTDRCFAFSPSHPVTYARSALIPLLTRTSFLLMAE